MLRWTTRLGASLRAAIALLVALTLVVTIGNPAQAAFTAPTQSQVIATDIAAAFGPSPVTTPPSLEELLLAPNTTGVAPVNEGGLTIWPDVQPGVSYGARSLGTGVGQQFVHIASASAPTAFDFYLKQAGSTVRPGPAGSALVYDAADQPQAVIPPPVAYEANGRVVPAHFEFPAGGTRLVKFVEHHAGMAYPIVADPIQILFAIFGAWVLFKCVVNGTNEAKNLKGQKWYRVLWGVSWVCVAGVI